MPESPLTPPPAGEVLPAGSVTAPAVSRPTPEGAAALAAAAGLARRAAASATLRAYRADWEHYAAWCARTGSSRIGLAAGDPKPEPARDDAHVLHLQRHQFGAAQRAGQADQQQRAVAPAAGARVAGGNEPPQQRQRERRRLSYRAPLLA